MRIHAVLLGIAALFLAGCDQPVAHDPRRPIVWRAPPLNEQSPGLNALRGWIDNAALSRAPLFALTADEKMLARTSQPTLQFSVQSSANAMRVEGEVFAVLVKLGYSRRMVNEAAGIFAVDYVSNRDITLSTVYREIQGPGEVKSSVVFTSRQ
ncbi:MAG TPA: hypothetical protein PK873_09790 [Pseudomonas sp.]|uniref:hypothetical protein n=1 Tax=Pseudomonas sp. TaxID=306 RepID=UPI002C2B50CA|nr:hypothetical protein [Pseudomonas sp.]HRL93844.1 hypothetical protein [Pseudomonas sp.]